MALQMEPDLAPAENPELVNVTIDGRDVAVPEGTTIWQAAKQLGIDIPVLCHNERFDPVGVCRMCVVDVGARVYAASCVRACEPNMEVKTATPAVERQRGALTALLLSDQPDPAEDPKETTTADNELLVLARRYGVMKGAGIPTATGRGLDQSNPVISVNHDACILCDRCVRACDDIQGNDVIGRSGKGYATRIALRPQRPDGSLVMCHLRRVVAACPTGALDEQTHQQRGDPAASSLRQVETVCPYCGVGCALTYHVDDDHECRRVRRGPRPARLAAPSLRQGALWVGLLPLPATADEAAHPPRVLLSQGGPVQRRAGRGRGRRKPGSFVDYAEVMPHFREASWDEALDLAASRLKSIHAEHGPGAIAGFGSAKCSNEEAYLFQKLIRAGFGTNNVDHCTRLCHASSVAALFEGIGSGAVSTTYGDIENADVALVAGSNTTSNHPVASSFFKQAQRRGLKMLVVDPRKEKMAEHADLYCQIKPGTDVAFYNGVMHEIIRLGLVDVDYIAKRTSNYDALVETVAAYPPERAAQICGATAEQIREFARTWGEARAAIAFWGMGISQHTTGTDNARCLIALCAITGNIGRPGTGLHPLRGQNNVQGASDMGLIPMFYPDYQTVDSEDVRNSSSAPGGGNSTRPRRHRDRDRRGGLARRGAGHVHDGREPFLVGPQHQQGPQGLGAARFPRRAGHLPHRDVRVRRRHPPGDHDARKGRHVHQHRPAGAARSQGARVTRRGAPGLGDRPGDLEPHRSRDELRLTGGGLRRDRLADAELQHLSHANLGPSGKLYPNPDPEHSDGTVVMFDTEFATPDGLAHLVPAEWLPAKELPNEEYPFVLNTGRLLEHWHTGSMTRRSFALDAIAPRAQVYLHADDAARLGVVEGDFVRVSSRHGLDRDRGAHLAPRDAGKLLHPVPLPGGGGEPAHHRRGRSVRQDPRVQVLRGARRESCLGRRGRRVSPPLNGAVPGREARAGRFPGPSLIPALTAIRREHGWLPRSSSSSSPSAGGARCTRSRGSSPFTPISGPSRRDRSRSASAMTSRVG